MDCTEPDPGTPEGRKGGDWFVSDWRRSFAPYLEAVVSRYRDESRILAWQIMNEAEANDADALRAFAAESAARMRAIDRNHVVSFGTLGRPRRDHDYGHEREPVPDALQQGLATSRALRKPFLVGEIGITAPTPLFTMDERAGLVAQKLRAAIEGGVGAT